MFFNKDTYYDPTIASRANKISMWDAVDEMENYQEHNKFGKNLFSKTDISYAFNSYGFRSDEFDQHSDVPIMFIGCSYTAGTGLPLDKIWTSQLLNKIKNKTGKNILHWNTASAGAGLDAISTSLYWHKAKFNQPIKYIVGLFPPFSRREYLYQNNILRYWHHPYDNSSDHDATDKLFMDQHFMNYQTLKNLMLIDAVSKSSNATVIYSIWEFPGTRPDEERDFIQENFPHFKYIKYPDAKYNVDLARDGNHPGPIMHEQISNEFWNNYFSSLEY